MADVQSFLEGEFAAAELDVGPELDRAFAEPDDGAPAQSTETDASTETDDFATTAEALERAWDDAAEKSQKLDAATSEVAQLDELFAPYTERLKDLGLTKTAAVKELLAWERAFETDPAAAIEVVVRHHAPRLSVDQRAELVRRAAIASGIGAVDPDRIQHLDVDRRVQHALAQQQALQQQQQVFGAIQAFAANTPDFDQVAPTMAGLAQAARAAGQPVDLPTIYRQAKAAMNAHNLVDPKAAAAKNREAVARARAARSPRTPSVPAGVANEDAPTDTVTILERAWDDAVGRR